MLGSRRSASARAGLSRRAPLHPDSHTAAPIRRWHICISGFLQRPGRPSGIHALWRLIRARVQNGDTCVECRTWSDDWQACAEWIHQFRPVPSAPGPASSPGVPAVSQPTPQPPRVFVYAYSWGAGFGFIQLARALERKGIPIECAVLSDPVYRSRLLSFRWLAFVPWCRLKIPANVREVVWVRQRMSLPRGHDLVAADPRATLIHPASVLSVPHTRIDDAPWFWSEALEVAARDRPQITRRDDPQISQIKGGGP